MSDSSQWFDHPIADLTPDQRAALDRSLRAEGIPATFGPTAVRTDVAYEARVTTLIQQSREAGGPSAPPGPGQAPTFTAPGPPTPDLPAPGYAAPAYQAPGYAVAPSTSAPTNSNAIVALVLGIASLAVCQLAGPAAVIVGQRARREIARTGEQGDGMALAGVITGAIASVLLALALIALLALVVIAIAGSG